jgi:glycosyltransferase involved in cell wall biosynthesis
MKLSVVMIVKNESAMLAECLEPLKDADEIIICDTGSTDDTVKIAEQYTDKVYTDFFWCDDFSKARNHANSKATGDWILSMDADHLMVNSIQEIKDEIKKLESLNEKIGLVRAKDSHWMAVLYKNSPDIFWVGECHEVLNIGAKVQTTLEMEIRKSPTHLDNPDRNLHILLVAEKTVRNKFYLAREYFERKNYKSAVFWMNQYLEHDTWLPERAEAFYVMAIVIGIYKKVIKRASIV